MKIARVSLTSYVHLQVGSVLVGDILSHFFIFFSLCNSFVRDNLHAIYIYSKSLKAY